MAKKNGIPQKYTVGMEFTHEQTATSKEILLLKAEVALDVKNVTYFTQVKGKGCRAEIVPESGSVKEGIILGVLGFATRDAKGGSLTIKMSTAMTPEYGAYFIDILKKPCNVTLLAEDGQILIPGVEEQQEFFEDDEDPDEVAADDFEPDDNLNVDME